MSLKKISGLSFNDTTLKITIFDFFFVGNYRDHLENPTLVFNGVSIFLKRKSLTLVLVCNIIYDISFSGPKSLPLIVTLGLNLFSYSLSERFIDCKSSSGFHIWRKSFHSPFFIDLEVSLFFLLRVYLTLSIVCLK